MSELDSPNSHRSGYVAIVGLPNVGKSTLLNALVHTHLAITSPRPQTTRNRVLGIRSEETYQIVFIDTPGIHESSKGLNRAMQDVVRTSMREIDLLVYVVDARSRTISPAELHSLEIISRQKVPKLLVPNKIDLIEKVEILPLIERFSSAAEFQEIVPISARSGDGVVPLVNVICKRLPFGPKFFPDDQITDLTEREIAAELVREKLFQQVDQEIPYASAVVVEKFEEIPGKRLTRIYATILVEKASQKSIVIGKGGARIKQIGEEARHEMEQLLDTRVYLELFVRVEKNWTRNPQLLRELGLMEKA